MDQKPIENYDIVRKAKEYAVRCHEGTNHLYDGQPYEVHLNMVAQTAMKYQDLLPDAHRSMVIAAAWCHDLIEDCRETYNDIINALGDKGIAEIVYACTNEKGKTRKQRANEKFYNELRENKLAVFVKLCDRIANVEYSKQKNSPMFATYYKENDMFIQQVNHKEEYGPMIGHLNGLFEHLENI